MGFILKTAGKMAGGQTLKLMTKKGALIRCAAQRRQRLVLLIGRILTRSFLRKTERRPPVCSCNIVFVEVVFGVWRYQVVYYALLSSIDMYNNDVGKRFMK
jgi:hypothetical protein